MGFTRSSLRFLTSFENLMSRKMTLLLLRPEVVTLMAVTGAENCADRSPAVIHERVRSSPCSCRMCNSMDSMMASCRSVVRGNDPQPRLAQARLGRRRSATMVVLSKKGTIRDGLAESGGDHAIGFPVWAGHLSSRVQNRLAEGRPSILARRWGTSSQVIQQLTNGQSGSGRRHPRRYVQCDCSCVFLPICCNDVRLDLNVIGPRTQYLRFHGSGFPCGARRRTRKRCAENLLRTTVVSLCC